PDRDRSIGERAQLFAFLRTRIAHRRRKIAAEPCANGRPRDRSATRRGRRVDAHDLHPLHSDLPGRAHLVDASAPRNRAPAAAGRDRARVPAGCTTPFTGEIRRPAVSEDDGCESREVFYLGESVELERTKIV